MQKTDGGGNVIDIRAVIAARNGKTEQSHALKQRGPAPRPRSQRRCVGVATTLTVGEKEWVHNTAAEKGLTASDYLRKLITREMIGSPTPSAS